MHDLFLLLKSSLYLILAGGLGVLATDRLWLGLMAAAALDWNQIIMGLIGLAAAYIAYKSHALTKKVDVVSTTLETTKKEINSQMTEALKTTLEKGVFMGVAKERARQELEISDRAKGVEVGRQEKPVGHATPPIVENDKK